MIARQAIRAVNRPDHDQVAFTLCIGSVRVQYPYFASSAKAKYCLLFKILIIDRYSSDEEAHNNGQTNLSSLVSPPQDLPVAITFLIMDPTYPAVPLFNIIGFLLVLLPLPWKLRAKAWTTGTSMFVLWVSLACLDTFVRTVVWKDNMSNCAPIYCDICTSYFFCLSPLFDFNSTLFSQSVRYCSARRYTSMYVKHQLAIIRNNADARSFTRYEESEEKNFFIFNYSGYPLTMLFSEIRRQDPQFLTLHWAAALDKRIV